MENKDFVNKRSKWIQELVNQKLGRVETFYWLSVQHNDFEFSDTFYALLLFFSVPSTLLKIGGGKLKIILT